MAGNVDVSQLKAGLERWGREVLEALAEGLGQSGMQLLNDATQELPTVPLRTDFLRGSGSVFVNGELVGTSAQGEGSPATEDENRGDDAKIVCRVGFNTAYAAVMHEGRWETGPLAGKEIQNYSEPGSGKYYLSRPLEENGEEYIRNAAAHARGKLGM